MGESHARSMDTGWAPGGEVWPVPVECLLNGMAPPDAHLMFGGNTMFATHFRHRFQPPVHLSTAHLAPLPSSINLNVSIPLTQHSIVEAGQVNDPGSATMTVADMGTQDAHGMTQQLSLENSEGMDETDEGTDDEEDEEVGEVPMTAGHDQQQHHHPAALSMTHRLETDDLPSCQQQVQQVVRTSLQHEHQNALLGLDASQLQSQCMQQKVDHNMVRQSLPGHAEQMNPGSVSMGINEGFNPQNTDSDADPNSGFSVHGKMYFEGRVVLHLKQWTDTATSMGTAHGFSGVGNGFGGPCGEPRHQKGGCAVCRLKSPASQENHRSQKEAHRHTVKGVLFTFEDCIIVELYPEPPPGSNQVDTGPKPPPPAETQLKDHSISQIPVEQYIPSSVTIQPEDPTKKYMPHMDVNCIGSAVHPAEPSAKLNDPVPQHPSTDDHSWWDEFESNDVLKRDGDGEDQNVAPATEPSNISQTAGPEEERRDCEFRPDENSFLSQGHLETAECRSVVALEDVEISSAPSSTHVSISNDNDSAVIFQTSEESQPCSEPEPVLDPVLTNRECKGAQSTKLRHCCSLCARSFPLKRLLKRHIEEKHTNDSTFTCPNCEQELSSKEDLDTHPCHDQIQSADESSMQADQASETPPTDSRYREVAITSTSNCVVDKNNSSEDECTSAAHAINERKVFKCDISQEECSSNQENQDFGIFNDCDEQPRTKRCTLGTSKKRSDHGKPFKCEICAKSFTVERRLENHKLSHSSERSSQCEKCGKRFARKDKLMRHMYVHSEEKMFSCDICQKRFSRRDKLSDHLKSHGGADEIHNCPMCQKQFLRPDILKQHVKLHTMGNKHQCPECLRFVTGKDRLEKHMARHQEAKALGQTLLCPLCTKYFIQKQSLKAHVKKFHPNADINLDGPDSDQPQQPHQADSLDPDADTNLKPTHSTSAKPKPFHCTECPRNFAKKQALKKHMRKHEISSKSSGNSTATSPSSDEAHVSLNPEVSSTSSSSLVVSSTENRAAAVSHGVAQAAHHLVTKPPDSLVNTNGPSSISTNATTTTHIPIIQQALDSTTCSTLQSSTPQESHPTQHLTHHLLTQGSHPSHPPQIAALGGSTTAHLHPNLSHHVTIPPMQHHVTMATPSAMCAPSYVLAYPHYSYQ